MTIGCTIGLALAVAATAIGADSPAHYSLKLDTLITPDMQSMGLVVKARVDDGPVLRMLLDSGAQHVVLDKHAAARSGRKSGSAFEMVGVGAVSRNCKRAAPGRLQIGDLVLHDCDIVVVDGQLLEGIDGIIPLSLFGDYLVRLDVRSKMLQLDAYPFAPVAGEGYLPVRSDHRLFFLQTVLNESQPGYVLLDTGATYNAVSLTAARSSRNYWSLSNEILLVGSSGGIGGFRLSQGVRFRCGERTFSADPAVAIDLSNFSRHHEFEVTGILGYPALRNSVVTVNYRDSLVRIEAK
jgi:predicted aspartyl protease